MRISDWSSDVCSSDLGDFVTAPEVSQMFGELPALALADLWQRAGCPQVAYVELGPGRGAPGVDALRAIERAGLPPPVPLDATSPCLRSPQPTSRPHDLRHSNPSTPPPSCHQPLPPPHFFHRLT